MLMPSVVFDWRIIFTNIQIYKFVNLKIHFQVQMEDMLYHYPLLRQQVSFITLLN